jgi:hypothetical protein
MMGMPPIKRLRRFRTAYGAEARSIGPRLSTFHDACPALAQTNCTDHSKKRSKCAAHLEPWRTILTIPRPVCCNKEMRAPPAFDGGEACSERFRPKMKRSEWQPDQARRCRSKFERRSPAGVPGNRGRGSVRRLHAEPAKQGSLEPMPVNANFEFMNLRGDGE